MTVSPAGEDYATIAYDIFTGARLWAARYSSPGKNGDQATLMVARAGRVFVTGTSYTTRWETIITVAYKG